MASGDERRRRGGKDRWATAEQLFHQALELEADRRGEFLESACPDPELRAEVELLLAGSEAAFRYFEAPLLVTRPGDGARTGQRVGSYRLQTSIGRGGMGEVFLARRDDGQFEQQVAVKVMNSAAAASAESRAQFLRERQILAELEHPGIARMLDGGLLDDGAPYFVMEHVEGRPITDWCHQRQADVDTVLDVFLQVCDAVAYAHRKLVVHRDLKPGNILVDPEGRVRLLDFGIARFLEPERADSRVTQLACRRLTPQYASPEQLEGRAIGTASDVYSLGVVLFELLAGRPPYDLEGNTPAEVREILRRGTTGACSEALRRNPLAEDRPRRRERRARRVQGDLDNIISMALRPEPERRYPSVEQFADDIRRHLSSEPVRARPDTLAYHASRFVRRNRVAVGAAVVVAGALLAGIAATWWQGSVAAIERDRAEQTLATLIGLIQTSDPSQGPGRAIPAETLLDRALDEVRSNLARDLSLRSDLTHAIGKLYMNLALREKAIPVLEEALELRQQAYGSTHQRVADTLFDLGVTVGRTDGRRAERLFREAIASRTALFGGNSLEVAEVREALAQVYFFPPFTMADRLNLATPELERALTIKRRLLGDEHPAVTDTLFLMPRVAETSAEKEGLLREVLERRRREAGGEDNVKIAEAMNDLALLLESRGPSDEGLQLLERSARMHTRLLGPDHVTSLTLENNLAGVYRDRGLYREAESKYRSVVEARVEAGLDRELGHAYTLFGLGRVLLLTGRPAEAVPALEQSIATLEAHQQTDLAAIARGELGGCFLELKRYGDAIRLLEPTYATLQQLRGKGDSETVLTASRLQQARKGVDAR